MNIAQFTAFVEANGLGVLTRVQEPDRGEVIYWQRAGMPRRFIATYTRVRWYNYCAITHNKRVGVVPVAEGYAAGMAEKIHAAVLFM